MKIKKVAQTPGVLATVSTSKINSDKDTYSCNYLNDNAVVVSPTEPSEGKLWIEKGKNLFDKNNYNLFNGLIDDSSLIWLKNTNGNFIYLEVKPNTTYTISKKTSISEFAVASGVNTPVIGEYATKFVQGSNKNVVTITTGANDKYLYVYVYYNTVSSGTLEEALNSLEIEEGTSIIPKKIYTKNGNGGYEEFYNEEEREVYSTEEQRIGTWIDGKPLYRKVYSIDSFPNNTTLEVPSRLTNITVRNLYGYCQNSIQMFPLNNANPTGVEYQVQLWYVYSVNNSPTNHIFIQTVKDRRDYSGCIVLEYTKTTD